MANVRTTEDGTPLVVPDTATADVEPEVARAEIEATRARMSGTIDEIEDVLLRKKERIQDRLDVFSAVKDRPLPSVGIAFGAGLLLGVVTGGDDEDGRSRVRARRSTGLAGASWDSDANHWENRSRRLLEIARSQEDDIRELQEQFGAMRAEALEVNTAQRPFREAEKKADGGIGSMISSLQDTIAGGVTGFISDAVDGWMHHHEHERRPAARS
ncbi:MAG: hypothetical protein M3409_05955 [Gemmatimonadota bacterium]|jgi:ElaB/YqjD/DUF883 family membrane-anchored ribosome-binding protein|nr:hypothetical protein [Gemmatimonadota bacterium]